MTKNIKCLILDDEPLAIDVIDNYLKRLPNIESFQCNNAIDAFQILQQGENRSDLSGYRNATDVRDLIF